MPPSLLRTLLYLRNSSKTIRKKERAERVSNTVSITAHAQAAQPPSPAHAQLNSISSARGCRTSCANIVAKKQTFLDMHYVWLGK